MERQILPVVFIFIHLPWISASFQGSAMNEVSGYKLKKVEGQHFKGNKTHTDFFYSILIDNDHLFVGARNYIFFINLHNFNEIKRITWLPSEGDVKQCLQKQKSQDDCQNYIRALVKTKADELYACGTSAYRPLCRTYTISFNNKKKEKMVSEESGTARVPMDHKHNSTYVYINGKMYSGTIADINGRDSLIYSKPIRTEQHNSLWLNDPSFVNSFTYENRIYFFFRETAVENINCAKVVFSRVARVCIDDPGGFRVMKNTWTSFSKVRLNCSIPGEYPFYFDEIQSTSELKNGSYRSTIMTSDHTPMLYAVFSTPKNSIRGSAVCAFRMADILKSFQGPYKDQKSPFHNWLPIRDIPHPHPGTYCPKDKNPEHDQTLSFIKSHPLMDNAVPAYGGRPIFIQTGFELTLTCIAVDWQVQAANHRFYDVLYIGTDNGRVIKAYNKGKDEKVQTVVIEILQVFPENIPITQLKMYAVPSKNSNKQQAEKKLLVVSHTEIKSIYLHRCHEAKTCSSCIVLKDPHCAWRDGKCLHSSHGLQNLESGLHPKCSPPIIETSPKPTTTTTTSLQSTTDLRHITTTTPFFEVYSYNDEESLDPSYQAHIDSLVEHSFNHQLPYKIHKPLPQTVPENTSCSISTLNFIFAIVLTFIITFVVVFPCGLFLGRFCRVQPAFKLEWRSKKNLNNYADSTIAVQTKCIDDANEFRAMQNSYEFKSPIPTTFVPILPSDAYVNNNAILNNNNNNINNNNNNNNNNLNIANNNNYSSNLTDNHLHNINNVNLNKNHINKSNYFNKNNFNNNVNAYNLKHNNTIDRKENAMVTDYNSSILSNNSYNNHYRNNMNTSKATLLCAMDK